MLIAINEKLQYFLTVNKNILDAKYAALTHVFEKRTAALLRIKYSNMNINSKSLVAVSVILIIIWMMSVSIHFVPIKFLQKLNTSHLERNMGKQINAWIIKICLNIWYFLTASY